MPKSALIFPYHSEFIGNSSQARSFYLLGNGGLRHTTVFMTVLLELTLLLGNALLILTLSYDRKTSGKNLSRLFFTAPRSPHSALLICICALHISSVILPTCIWLAITTPYLFLKGLTRDMSGPSHYRQAACAVYQSVCIFLQLCVLNTVMLLSLQRAILLMQLSFTRLNRKDRLHLSKVIFRIKSHFQILASSTYLICFVLSVALSLPQSSTGSLTLDKKGKLICLTYFTKAPLSHYEKIVHMTCCAFIAFCLFCTLACLVFAVQGLNTIASKEAKNQYVPMRDLTSEQQKKKSKMLLPESSLRCCCDHCRSLRRAKRLHDSWQLLLANVLIAACQTVTWILVLVSAVAVPKFNPFRTINRGIQLLRISNQK
ncbi:hypothetical protein Ciccas_004588 [Cichlidogyrus casuarinus]|uniref:G-protein coupled receptors family 1 profile domain-containing protein n=1 Tax=Cichlidogyrus casuarinus TaxID=1844966 RepID=A0ABD2QBY8_9PLAT